MSYLQAQIERITYANEETGYAVVMPVLTTHYIMLQRNLIYTGITRGRRLVVLVGIKIALAMADRNNKTGKRYSNLDGRLRGMCG